MKRKLNPLVSKEIERLNLRLAEVEYANQQMYEVLKRYYSMKNHTSELEAMDGEEYSFYVNRVKPLIKKLES